VRPLLATPASSLRNGLEAVTAIVGVGAAASYAAGRHRAVETGPASEDAEDLPFWRSDLLRRVVSRPPVLVALVLGLLAVVAGRDLFGAGRLMGGALLPTPDSAGDLWRTYTENWHAVGLGSDSPAPPYLAVLALLGTALLGNASAAVTLVLLGAVPLAGLSAYLALRRVVVSRVLRLWGAATYALLPALLGAVAAGRLGTTVVALLLPLAAVAAGRALSRDSYRAAWAAGLLLAVMTAFSPAVYLIVAALAVLVAALGWVRGPALLRLGALLVVAPLVLLPWLPSLAARPGRLLLEAGLARASLTDTSLPPLAVFLLHPGGPGMYPLVVSAGLLLAALAALLRPDRRKVVLAGWLVALLGIVAAAVVSRVRVGAPGLGGPVLAWAGTPTLLAGAGLVLAAVVGAEGARARIAARSFGWRQVTAAGVVVLSAAVPLLAGGWWAVRGAGDPLARRNPVLLPAFVAAEGDQPERPRTLVLRQRGAGSLSYALLRADGPRLGDADTAQPGPARRLDAVVADLASGRGGDAAAELVPYGVRFVLVDRPVPAALGEAIDAVPGLVRISGPDRSALWKVRYPSGRVRLVDAAGPAPPTVLPAGPIGLAVHVPPAAGARLLVLADRRAPGWRAELAGHRLTPRTYAGWAQAFVVPASGGLLTVRHEDRAHSVLLWLQAAAVVLVLVLALPSARRTEDPDEPATHVPSHARAGGGP
ncbi:MAG: hypothetical protein QOH80_584, partial [Actinomycetota bacterium]|nr:hypothetical protein [Actinomycetota bacterium]